MARKMGQGEEEEESGAREEREETPVRHEEEEDVGLPECLAVSSAKQEPEGPSHLARFSGHLPMGPACLVDTTFCQAVQRQHREAVFQTSCWLLYLKMCKPHPGGTGFEDMKGSWREVEAWHPKESLRDAIEESSPVAEGTQHFGDASNMRQAPRTSAQRSQPEPGRQAVCAAEDGARDVTQAFWRSPDAWSTEVCGKVETGPQCGLVGVLLSGLEWE
ncbi:hypothetical protein STEG23_021959, partial [Scotinomys teguina]